MPRPHDPFTGPAATPGAASWAELFALRPAKGAVVSEISEATASAPVPAEQRVNFHIGNPVEDPRLVATYARIVLDLDPRGEAAPEELVESLRRQLGWSAEESDRLTFLVDLIRRSGPYLPRGGFLRSKPVELVRRFAEWLGSQPEPLVYDLGESSGRREIILASGGLTEGLRVFFHGLSRNLERMPAAVLAHGFRFPAHFADFEGLEFQVLPDEESGALAQVERVTAAETQRPCFVLLGRILSEESRRTLRLMTLERPLFVVEANNAPNHASLAREARMMNRTLRFLTPGIFAPEWSGLSLVFIAGYHEFVRLIEKTHFELKGTPSAAEVELLTYLLRRGLPVRPAPAETTETLYQEQDPWLGGIQRSVGAMVGAAGASIVQAAVEHAAKMETALAQRVDRWATRLNRTPRPVFPIAAAEDPLAGLSFREILDSLPARGPELVEAFKSAFLRHHAEYRPEACVVVSGSARTALGLLGFHCGLREVVLPDLSWTYEHCFPKVTAVPLTPEFGLDVERLVATVDRKLVEDGSWRECGAVVINNPHNASGQVFPEEALRRLLVALLERGVRVIDDLSYENVAPSSSLTGPATLRQLAGELARLGYISSEQADRVITVHSLSKTDCLAGARLCVVEIREPELRRRLEAVNRTIAPNLGALLLAYLFYRRSAQSTHSYWRLRNVILDERMSALEQAVQNLPGERNRYGITITRPAGGMYPRMTVERLPQGVSLDWIASCLARQGVGLIPLSTFAHTEEGMEIGRKSFRLTLGGPDGADRLLSKTRRVLIDLNRIIAEEEARYTRKRLSITPPRRSGRLDVAGLMRSWEFFTRRVKEIYSELASSELKRLGVPELRSLGRAEFFQDRLNVFQARFHGRLEITEERLALAEAQEGRKLEALLEQELQGDNLARRQAQFRERLYDRTVHPTQMYSIEAESCWEQAIERLLDGRGVDSQCAEALARALVREFAGLNVAIPASAEGDELLLDLDCLIAAEDFMRLRCGREWRTYLSYWGDWDGSNRPSGQGHHLVATVLMENVARMGRLLELLLAEGAGVAVNAALIQEVRRLPAHNRKFRALFDEINRLTQQLERRYRGLLPFEVRPSPLRRLGMKLKVARDPVVLLWEHNDRLERRMLELRRQRRRTLEYYFELNRALRDCLRSNLGELRRRLRRQEVALAASAYRDLLSRFVITPRIHQNMVTAADPFAIDTTAYNLTEINEIAGRYGNPGMILALQVSMSSEPEALISLDRKLRGRRQEALRTSEAEVPSIWLVPLFEGLDIVQSVRGYLDKLWQYAIQSRRLTQSPEQRFAELISEVFIAGSDLSQEAGQTAALVAFRKAKYEIVRWLAERGLAAEVRIKLGAGEPMQRQGAYYAPVSGRPAFDLSPENRALLSQSVGASAQGSARYAATPLMGLLASGDLITYQSNASERLRHLPVAELAQVLHHVAKTQRFAMSELRRAAEPLTETRLPYTARGLQDLRRLTVGMQDELLEEFVKLATENFRAILYGREEDVVGIYAISYFIARTLPPLRDRPTVRPASGPAASRGQRILERIAGAIPFARYGSSLRAIAHNQAQTFLLGINQLTTGLFRSLNGFTRAHSEEGEGDGLLADRILPHLPVYEILESLRLYQDLELSWLWQLERAYPAGNSAFTTLREDVDSIRGAIPLFQKELLRRHGVPVAEFFEGERFIPRLLPALRPDLAVLLQPDLFNTDLERLLEQIGVAPSAAWRRQVGRLLEIPESLRFWRRKAWELLLEPVYDRVSRFVELATALYSVTRRGSAPEPAMTARPMARRQPPVFLRGASEDSLQQFLAAAFEYLSEAPPASAELPANVVRAMKKDVERLVSMEEQALPPQQQELLRFYLLQMARLAGENG